MGAWVLRRDDGTIWSVCAMQQLALDGTPLPNQSHIEDTDPDLVAYLSFVPVPGRVAAGDFVRALYELGWLDAVKTAVASAGGLAAEMWNHAASFERHHPMVAQIGAAIGKTDADLDALFRKAATYS